MKALLKTRCGCTRMIDLVERCEEIKIPMTAGMKEVTFRLFRYRRPVLIDDVTLLVYEEKE